MPSKPWPPSSLLELRTINDPRASRAAARDCLSAERHWSGREVTDHRVPMALAQRTRRIRLDAAVGNTTSHHAHAGMTQ
jgi:hypothetical protein